MKSEMSLTELLAVCLIALVILLALAMMIV